jgi:ferritin-like metal-binding protein YciE
MKLETLQELFVDEIKDLYSAENQILNALPKMANAATCPELKSGFNAHLEQTKGHISRLEQICRELDVKPGGKFCKGTEGLLEEGAELIRKDSLPEVLDAGLISAAQRVEHYEIAGYGTCVTYAKQLGYTGAAGLLVETLIEEKETDLKLTAMAESHINSDAVGSVAMAA